MDGAAVDALLDVVRSPRLALLLLEARPDARRPLTAEFLLRLEAGADASRADTVAYVALCGVALRRWRAPDSPPGDWWAGTFLRLSRLWHGVALPSQLGRVGAELDVFGPLAGAPLAGAASGGSAEGQRAFEILVAFWRTRQERVCYMREGRALSDLRRRLESTQRPAKRRRPNTTAPRGS